MPKGWPFAKLVQDAAKAGGPAQFVAKIRQAGEIRGAVKATLVLALGYGGAKLAGWAKRKYDESQEAGKQAEAELIAAIKEYEAEHPEVAKDASIPAEAEEATDSPDAQE